MRTGRPIGSTGKHQTPHLTAAQREEALRLYCENELAENEIGAIFGKTGTCIRTLAKKNGLSRVYDKREYGVNDGRFSEEWTNDHSYWLGLLHADGHVSSHGNSISLELKTEDGYLVRQFAEFVGYTGSVKDLPPHDFVSTNGLTYTSSGTALLRFSSKEMAEDLRRMGVVAKDKSIHPVPIGYNHYLRGVFDGNGSIMRQKKIGSWSWAYTGHMPAISEFCKVANDLGIAYSVRVLYDGRCHGMRISSTGGSLAMMRWLYAGYSGGGMTRKRIIDPNEHLWSSSGYSVPKSMCTEWEASRKRWRVRASDNGRSISIGRFRFRCLAWSAYAKYSLARYGKKSPFYRIHNIHE